MTRPIRHPWRRSRRWAAWACLCAVAVAPVVAPVVAQAAPARNAALRVEPPFWWIGFRDSELQLMISGQGVAALRPTLSYPGVSVSRTRRGDSPNYLFVYLRVDPSTRPGGFDIDLSGKGRSLRLNYRLERKNPDPAHAKGFSSADAIYLITPDRFANGDPGNDAITGMGDAPDRAGPDSRHGGDIPGISARLDYIDGMGFTAVWLNPVLETRMPARSYYGYATTDFYRVDPRLGSKLGLRELAGAARRRGIGLIMDVIVNHIGKQHPWVADPPNAEWINFGDRYVPTSHEPMAVQDPHASARDRRGLSDGWFAESMPDLNQRRPLLADYLIQNALWWIEYLGLAGMRVDAYPYPDKNFMKRWNRRVRMEYPRFTAVGGAWTGNPATVSYWQRGKRNIDGYEGELPSLMDFPLREALVSALAGNGPAGEDRWLGLYRALANDFQYPDPAALVVFADNARTRRVFPRLGADPAALRMALTYLLTVRGAPQIYYGTEILMSGDDGLGAVRSDFPGGWPGDRRNAFTGQGLSTDQRATQLFLRDFLRWRKSKTVLHHGQLMHFLPRKNVYTYFRYDDNNQVMVAMNHNARPVSLGTRRFQERLDGYAQASDPFSAKRYALNKPLTLPARSALVLEMRRKRAVSEPAVRTRGLRDL